MVSAHKYYKLLELLDKADEHQHMKILMFLDHPYIIDPSQLDRDLEGLTHIFKSMILIFVDEKRGFFILEEPDKHIRFESITRGRPRFRAFA